MINNNNFIVKEIPNLNPLTQRTERLNFWKEQKRRCMEGYWVGGKWMPGELYHYVNFWNIEVGDRGRKNAGKIIGLPWLRDLEWEKALIASEAFGFSGFEKDNKYTCNYMFAPENVKDFLEMGDITQAEVDQYTYIKPREYLRKNHGTDLGKPLYLNPAKNVIDVEARGGGKDLEASTLIHGEHSVYPISEVRVGDRIYGADGKLTTVIQRRDFTDQMQYKVTFSDGRSVQCGGGHLWTVYRKQRNGRKKVTLELQEIYKDYKIGKRGDSRYMIPMCQPIEYSEKELPIDPYFFGLWLGDGCSYNTTITTMDEPICESISQYAESIGMTTSRIGLNVRVIPKAKGGTPNKILNALRELNVIKNKHIPDIYLKASPTQRLALLQGLMDSDGYSDDRHIEFTTSYEGLKRTVPQLIHSLGIRCKIREKKTSRKTALRISLLTDLSVFRLQRKLQNVGINTSAYAVTNRTKSAIVDIQPTEVKPSVCIAVDNEDSLFVVGEDYVVTHNSFFASSLISHNFVFDGSHDYDAYMHQKKIGQPMISQTLVGAIQGMYSADLLTKFKLGFDRYPGTYEFYGQKWPAPFSIDTRGSLEVGTVPMVSLKSGSKLHHRTFADRAYAANGTRPSRAFLEEIGFFHRLIESLGAMKDLTYDSAFKFGTIWMFGTGGDMEGGSCVCAGSKVYTADGRLVNVEELTKQDGTIGFDYENQQSLSQSIPWMQPTSEKSCVEIELTSGRKIRCSTDHPILFSKWKNFRSVKDIGRDDDGKRIRKYSKKAVFKEAGKLEIGEQVALADTVDIWPKGSHPHARLVGLLVGDGNYSARTIPVHSTCDENINKFIEENYDTTIVTTYPTKDNQVYKEQRIRGIMPMIRELGLYGQTKHDKRSPNQLFSWNKQTVAEYVGGYFDADGSVTGNRIELTSISRSLLDDLQLVLQKFGIHSTIRQRKGGQRKIATKTITYSDFCVLHIKDAESVIRFAANITLLSEHKSFALLKAVEHHSKVKPCKADNLPGLRFDTIKKITDIGMQPIYNFQTDHTHTYLVEGIVTHNTLAAQEVFYNPEAYDCLVFEDEWEGRGKIGYFVPAEKALNDFKEGPNLETNYEKAAAYLEKARKKAKGASSPKPYNDELQNRPRKPSEAFLAIHENKFPISQLEDAFVRMTSKPSELGSHWTGFVTPDTESDKLRWKNVDERPLRDWPVKSGINIEGCIELMEMPKRGSDGLTIPGRYIAATDPVDDDDVEGSLQSTFIMDTFTERIVAEYTARTYQVEDYWENARLLLKYYGAQCNYENNKKGFYGHMKNKNSVHLLADTPAILRDMNLALVKGDGNKSKGTYASNTVNEYGRKLYNIWLKKPAIGKENMTNAQSLRSLGLIQESINYNPKGNFDRISAIEKLFIMLADKQQQISGSREDLNEAAAGLAADPYFNKNYERFLRKNGRRNFITPNEELKSA